VIEPLIIFMVVVISILAFNCFAIRREWIKEVRRRKERELALRNPGSKQMVFVRETDSRTVQVEGCACRTCKNFFWVANGEFEAASFCPYCGIKFTSVVQVTGEEMRDIQVL